ncbi:MAG: YceI family protein [Deltaproteobacteria bacterium]|nr:YceI family protein [Deltaproteobacteria bacterium]
MKKSMPIVLVFAALCMLVVPFAHAEAPAWTVDKIHSGVHFDIQHIYATVRGSFDEFDALIRFDPANLGESRFDFTVAVKSVNTQNDKRDQHLMSSDFFDEGNYSKMAFKSSAIRHLEGDSYTVTGTMTIKDVSQNVTVPFTYFGSKPNPFDPKQFVAGFEAGLTIDRLSYHVGNGKFFKMGVVGKDVTVLITIEAIRDK